MLTVPTAFLDPGNKPQLSNNTLFASDGSNPYSSTVTLTFKADGTLEKIDNSGTVTVPMQWWSAGASGGIGSSYDVRCKEITSGTTFTAEAAAVGTYIQMSSNRPWTLSSTTLGGKQIIATFQIVATGGSTVLAEAGFTFAIENGLL